MVWKSTALAHPPVTHSGSQRVSATHQPPPSCAQPRPQYIPLPACQLRRQPWSRCSKWLVAAGDNTNRCILLLLGCQHRSSCGTRDHTGIGCPARLVQATLPTSHRVCCLECCCSSPVLAVCHWFIALLCCCDQPVHPQALKHRPLQLSIAVRALPRRSSLSCGPHCCCHCPCTHGSGRALRRSAACVVCWAHGPPGPSVTTSGTAQASAEADIRLQGGPIATRPTGSVRTSSVTCIG